MTNRTHDQQNSAFTGNRRDILKGIGVGVATAGVGAGTLLGIGPAAAQAPAAPAGDVLMKTIPRTGEAVPAIGLGTYLTFDTLPGEKRDHLREVMRQFWEGGGRLLDTSPLYGTSEITVGHFAAALGIMDQLFIANKIWSTGAFLADDSHAARSLEQSQQRLWRKQFDVMQVHSLTNVENILPLLRAWKKEGHVRLVGVTHHEPPYFELLADAVEREKPDFVQVRYNIFYRRAEERILKAAAEVGAAVLVNMPLDKARLTKLVEGRQLPDFAKEIGVTTWSQFFLKWIVSHPAVTCAIPATANPEHAKENMGALRGPMPDAAMRERMVKHMETIPGFADLEKAPRYPGKRYPGIIARAQGRLRERNQS